MEYFSTIRGMTVFRGLRDLHLRQLARAMRPEVFPPGTVIFREGDMADRLYVVAQGSVRLSKIDTSAGEEELGVAGSGSFIGEFALLGVHTRVTTATAREHTELLALHEDDVEALFRDDPELAAAFFRMLAEDLADTLREALKDVLFLKGFVRTHHTRQA